MASDDEGGLDLFQEPVDYFEPEKEATFATHQLLSGKEFTVRLVGHNPLWVRLQHSMILRNNQGFRIEIMFWKFFVPGAGLCFERIGGFCL